MVRLELNKRPRKSSLLHTCIVKLIVTWCTTPAVGPRDVVLSAIHTSNVKRNFYTLSVGVFEMTFGPTKGGN